MGTIRLWVIGCRAAGLAGAALLAAAPAVADVKDGVDAWMRGDYAAAIAEWQGPAARGDTDAMFNLGQAYKLGKGVKQDLAKAEELFAKAAAQGHPQAGDNYGLLLFQRGERAKALPYLQRAVDRGDPRAQYLIGVGHFNGDIVPKDWVRAYALTSLARQAGLPQATSALAQMDQHIPLAQRQQGTTLAGQLATQADANRARQFASADLGAGQGEHAPPSSRSLPSNPAAASAQSAAQVADNARRAGADFAAPPATAKPPAKAVSPASPPSQASPSQASAAPAPKPPAPAAPPVTKPPSPAVPVAANGPWRVQLGAFAVAGNADGLWNRIKGRPELSGRPKLLVRSGNVTKLQAGGFATSGDAQAACSRLSRAGLSCLPVRN